jgi:hypothetical protein
MTKHVAIDRARLQAAVRAIEKRRRPDINQIGLAQRSQIAKLRRDLGPRLEPVFADAGLDVKKINQILTQHQSDVRRALAKHKAETSKEVAALRNTLQQGIENKRKALEQIAGKPYLTTPIPILTPFFIYALPAGMLHDSHIEPSNNWAKLTYTDSRNVTYPPVKLSFYFAWQNPVNYVAVINCDTDLVVNGVCQARADPGFFLPGSAWLGLWAELNVYLGETEINWQAGQLSQIAGISAEGGWGPFGDGDLESKNISDTYHLSCSDILVQGDQVVIFEVSCVASYWIDEGGDIVLDFDFDPANYQIMCPALNIDLLTPPGSVESAAFAA